MGTMPDVTYREILDKDIQYIYSDGYLSFETGPTKTREKNWVATGLKNLCYDQEVDINKLLIVNITIF